MYVVEANTISLHMELLISSILLGIISRLTWAVIVRTTTAKSDLQVRPKHSMLTTSLRRLIVGVVLKINLLSCKSFKTRPFLIKTLA